MKKIFFIAAATALTACGEVADKQNDAEEKEQTTEKTTENQQEANDDEASFPYHDGMEFDASQALSVEEFNQQLNDFTGDSMRVTVTADISAACKKKGCWMKLDVNRPDEMMVRFRDYEFFVPLNSAGRKTTVHGVAFYDTISVAQLKHYAEDGGVDADSIAKITEPEVTLAFLADGVIVE